MEVDKVAPGLMIAKRRTDIEGHEQGAGYKVRYRIDGDFWEC
jgi:hypothetical protein